MLQKFINPPNDEIFSILNIVYLNTLFSLQ